MSSTRVEHDAELCRLPHLKTVVCLLTVMFFGESAKDYWVADHRQGQFKDA